LWGLPAEVWFELNLFNEDLFAGAGQSPPDAAWTWERWLDAARRLTAAGANSQVRTFGTALPSWELFVWNWGGEILNKAGTECVLNRAPAPDALQWRADANLRHQVVPTTADLGGQSTRAFFTSGRLGMFSIGNWALQDIASATTMRWNAVPLPQGKSGPATIGAGANYALFAGGKQQDAAWALLTDLALGDGLKTLLVGSALFPAFRPAAKQELLPSYKPDWLKATLKAGEKARQPHYDHPRYVEINQAIVDQLAPLWNGDKPAQAAADEAARQVNLLLKQA
jgi:ABC-type glycerol-3-phosphate transport system substrate-binding protein